MISAAIEVVQRNGDKRVNREPKKASQSRAELWSISWSRNLVHQGKKGEVVTGKICAQDDCTETYWWWRSMGSAAWWVEGKSRGWGRLGTCMFSCKHWRTKEYTSPCVCGCLSLLLPGKFHSIPKLNNMTLFMKRLVNNIPASLRALSYNVGNALICLQGRDLQLGQATMVVMLPSLTTRPTGASAMKLGLPKLQGSC